MGITIGTTTTANLETNNVLTARRAHTAKQIKNQHDDEREDM